jgi:hypothetical protein
VICISFSLCVALAASTQEPVQSDGLLQLQAAQEPAKSAPQAPATASPPGSEVEPPSRGKGLYPWLAVDSAGGISACWTEPRQAEGHGLLWAQRKADGSWTEPEQIASGKDWFVNWADHPMHAVDEQGRVLATWLQKVPGSTYSYQVQTRLRDAAGNWGEPRLLHEDSSPTEHGFVSIAPAMGGGFVIAWLDGRATAEKKPMQLRARRLLADGNLGPELLVDPRVCDCCGTSLRATAEGVFQLSYRDRSEAEVRDLGQVQLRLGKQAELVLEAMPAPVDGWVMPGCPVNGPAQAADSERIATAWFTMNPTPRVRLGYGMQVLNLADGPGVAGRVAVAATEHGFAVAWLETRADRTAWWLQELHRKPSPSPSRDGAQILVPVGTAQAIAPSTGSRADGFLCLAPTKTGVLAVWTDGKSQLLQAKEIDSESTIRAPVIDH